MHGLVDIGVNLTASSFKKDINDVIERAVQAGVAQQVVTGTSLEHSHHALELVTKYPGVLSCTVGVHPHHATECSDKILAELEALAANAGVVAIGECGLDFNRNLSPPAVQVHAFEAQLELASGLDMPVFLHQRDAHDDFMLILKRWRHRLPAAVTHCFTGDVVQLKDCLELDLHIGVTGWICDQRRGQALQQSVSHIPANRLMIETDAPYLLPRDLESSPKDRRNEPMYLPHICKAVAGYRGDEASAVAASTAATARAFFSIG
ncbi:MAG: TatD family hydrolase [Gammaproteobacteria bacterium]|nr:TatD family hydrolase [Gammaproteobacteria bacterium]